MITTTKMRKNAKKLAASTFARLTVPVDVVSLSKPAPADRRIEPINGISASSKKGAEIA